MQKRILDFYFNVNLSLPVIIILEPSEENWNKIFNITLELTKSLPGRVEKIYFLGNKKEYKVFIPQDFEIYSAEWIRENLNRPLLIGKILENLSTDNKKRIIIVINSKEIIDLRDWENSEISKWIVFFNIGEESFIDLKRIENPIASVYIKNSDFVPLAFEIKPENIKSIIDYNDGKFILKINGDSEQLEGHLKTICSDELPKLIIQRTKGDPEEFLFQIESTWFSELQWKNIPDNLLTIINSGIDKKDFKCPNCNKIHNYKTLICPEGGTILTDFPLNTVILIKNNKYLSLSDWFAYPLKNNERIITIDGNLYDWTKGKWEKVKVIDLYEEVDNETWGLLHRI